MSQPDIHRYMRHGTLPQLRLFEAVARLGSFARAAEELHMAQPTASVQIKKLSGTVGVALVEQIGKRLYLTEAGRRLHESCEEIFRVFAKLDESLSAMRALESGRLKLAVSTTGICFAPRLLGAFARVHPGVETSMQAHNRQTLVERLKRNEDDLYLFADAPEMEGVVAQELLPNPLVVLARDDHPLASQRTSLSNASPPNRSSSGRKARGRDGSRCACSARMGSVRGSRWNSPPTRRSRRLSLRALASPSCRATPSDSIRNHRDTCAST